MGFLILFATYAIIIFLILIPVFFVIIIILDTVNTQKKDRSKKDIIKKMIVVSIIMACILQSDFYKSRKTVDEDWMIGRTLWQVRLRYSYPLDREKYQETIFLEDKEYQFAVREIFEWNLIDGVLGEIRYYVCTDDGGKIIDVHREEWGGFAPASDYSYNARW